MTLIRSTLAAVSLVLLAAPAHAGGAGSSASLITQPSASRIVAKALKADYGVNKVKVTWSAFADYGLFSAVSTAKPPMNGGAFRAAGFDGRMALRSVARDATGKVLTGPARIVELARSR